MTHTTCYQCAEYIGLYPPLKRMGYTLTRAEFEDESTECETCQKPIRDGVRTVIAKPAVEAVAA